MGKFSLTQYEKNCLFYSLQDRISRNLKDASLAIYDRTEETVFYELDNAKAQLELYYKLDKEGWGGYDD